MKVSSAGAPRLSRRASNPVSVTGLAAVFLHSFRRPVCPLSCRVGVWDRHGPVLLRRLEASHQSRLPPGSSADRHEIQVHFNSAARQRTHGA